MRILIATLLLVATAGSASAYCIAVPDDRASAYVRNGLKKTICLNEEIAANTEMRNWQVEVNTALGRLDRDFVGSKLDAIRPPEVPDYARPHSWP